MRLIDCDDGGSPFSDPGLAAVYDAFCPPEGRSDFRFYLPLVMSARTVLDVGARWDQPQVSTSTLRFLDANSLSSFLSDAAMAIDQRFGDWNGEPLRDTSPEIITIAERR